MGAQDLTTSISEASEEIGTVLNHVAIGLAKLDYEDFYKDNYFANGHIYIDEDKSTYKALEFGAKGFFSLYGMLNPSMYSKASEAKKRGIKGNMQGDGTQLGGTLVVDKLGNVIFSHVQKEYADQPDFSKILESIKKYKTENKL